MVKHNNAIANVHHRKWWQRHVRTWFDQAGRKHRRQTARQDKVAKSNGKPIDQLRPIVHCPTQKYNFKVRAGRGFSIEELKAAKLTPRAARTIGIAVDLRRKNKSEEGLQANVERLQGYLEKVVVFPRGSKPKKGNGGVPNDVLRKEVSDKKLATSIEEAFPIVNHKSMLVA